MDAEQFKTTWDVLLAVARMAQMIPAEDVQNLLSISSMADSLGPIMYPTEYRAGMQYVEEQRILASAFLVFRNAIEQVKAIGRGEG